MVKEVADFVVSLFKGLRLPFRWLAALLSLVVIVLALLGYEHLTGHFYFSRLERKVALLKELHNIASQGIDANHELYPIYRSAVNELVQYEIRTIAFPWFPSVNFGDPVTWGKAISGALVWVLILVIGVSSDVKKVGRLSGATIGVGIVVLMIAALFAWLGTLIPTIFNPWVNYIGFPVVQVVVFYLLGRKKKPANIEGQE